MRCHMPNPALYTEHIDSQAPALRLLEKIGFSVLSPDAALAVREGSISNVLLRTVLEEKLQDLNQIIYKGRSYDFSDGNIHEAIEALRNLPEGGLVHTNEKAYDLLTLGKSLEQEIEGDRKSHPLYYIDWENPNRNAFHATYEYKVAGRTENKILDIVLFINGIPFVAIECKRRDGDDAVGAGLRQIINYQNVIPQLFHYTQLVISAQPNEAKYGTVGTEERFWSVWREEDDAEAALIPLLKGEGPGGSDRLPTEQDRSLWSLCRPERLLELAYYYSVFDAGVRKIARYQQYFAVKHIMKRVRQFDENGRRKGGVIWHTQGSGKSLTMVMLGKALSLAEDITGSRVVLVTDRKSLDKQIEKTFRHCGKQPVRARSGSHLVELLLDDRIEVITTLVNKFDTAIKRYGNFKSENPNIFVLVDESHRSQYGQLNARMRQVLPKACYLGFTGTPLLKQEKNTARKFGGIIEPAYTIERAVEDKAVVPLLYEGRHPKQIANEKQIDRGFERLSSPLVAEQKRDLKKKAIRKESVMGTQQAVEEVVYDIIDHYVDNWQGTGFKAQLAVSGKAEAIRAHQIMSQDGRVKSAVVISPPDEREGERDDIDPKTEVIRFWREEITERFADADEYQEHVVDLFNEEDGVEILIVVSMLLTGFDAPRNTVLYIFKNLREHTLLQAIARVNRLFEGKDFGYIVDYWGILEDLDAALTSYGALSGYEEEDLAGAIISVREEVDKLGQYHSDLVDHFASVKNKEDIENLERFLGNEEKRDTFYDLLARFSKTLQLAASTTYYYDVTPEGIQSRYLRDLKFYQRLRKSVRLRYHEAIDYREYDNRVRKLLDRHIAVDDIERIIEPVDILDREAVLEELGRLGASTAAKADAIASRTKKVLTERMDEDPVLYQRLSELIDEAIDKFYQHRIDEQAYLNLVAQYERQAQTGETSRTPSILHGHPEALTYFRMLMKEIGESQNGSDEQVDAEILAKAGLKIESIIESLKIVDWQKNPDIEMQMRGDIEDYLIESSLVDVSVPEGFDSIDRILDAALTSAKRRAE